MSVPDNAIKELFTCALERCGDNPSLDDYFLALKSVKDEIIQILDVEMRECVCSASGREGVQIDGFG